MNRRKVLEPPPLIGPLGSVKGLPHTLLIGLNSRSHDRDCTDVFYLVGAAGDRLVARDGRGGEVDGLVHRSYARARVVNRQLTHAHRVGRSEDASIKLSDVPVSRMILANGHLMLGLGHAQAFLRVCVIIGQEQRRIQHLNDEAANAITVLLR